MLKPIKLHWKKSVKSKCNILYNPMKPPLFWVSTQLVQEQCRFKFEKNSLFLKTFPWTLFPFTVQVYSCSTQIHSSYLLCTFFYVLISHFSAVRRQWQFTSISLQLSLPDWYYLLSQCSEWLLSSFQLRDTIRYNW